MGTNELETKAGTIQKVSVDEGIGKDNKPYKRWVFVIEDKKYSTFDENIGNAGFKAGDYVVMKGEQRGIYWNMSTMEKGELVEVDLDGNLKGDSAIIDLLRQILAELKRL